MITYQLKYHQPAEDSAYGWEHQSLPIGNGYMGANIFGIVERERIQITENSVQNPGHLGGLNNFAEIYLHFDHDQVTNYERGLKLNEGVAYCYYTADGVDYEREYFTSYPQKALVIRLGASHPGALSFALQVDIPFIKDYAIEPGDGGGKSGEVTYTDTSVMISGKMHYYNILFEGQLQVTCKGGEIRCEEGRLIIEAADEVVIKFVLGTNYELDEAIFLEDDPKKKLKDICPHDKVTALMDEVAGYDYEALKEQHLADFQELFQRVELELGQCAPEEATDVLLSRYIQGEHIPYLEMLYFQYGRYLLISSSRKGTLPANLQGVWNCHDQSPWGSGYWHNINVQMNYWPAFVTNLPETFESYVDFNQAFRKKTEQFAAQYIQAHNPENYTEEPGGCGWTIGTGTYPYTVSKPGGHSGPGTGGLTTKLFWDYYAFTQDEDVLREVTYPTLLSMSKFLTKTVRKYDNDYLTSFSASPEQMLNRSYTRGGRYYHTIGCAFDQQMIYENGLDFIRAANHLGDSESKAYKVQQEQINHYKPVEIGWSGQIKEYAEEKFYGEIGEYHHRHISHLVALYPGAVINHETPAWLDSAKTTLTLRGDESTGWALAHRLNAWARVGDGNHAYLLIRNLLEKRTMDNLWDLHPPFQIDGNFGGTSGIAEMLIQSHEGYINILPALPSAWAKGSYSGLVARENFEVSVQWEDGKAIGIQIKSNKGGMCKVRYNSIHEAQVIDEAQQVVYTVNDTLHQINFMTESGKAYVIQGIQPQEQTAIPKGLQVCRDQLVLIWQQEEGRTYNLYRAIDNEACYEQIAKALTAHTFKDTIDFSAYTQVTYKLTATEDGRLESVGITQTINHATQLEQDRYWVNIGQSNPLV